jgi:Ca2+-binding RTX toxin-like protein
MRKAHIGVTFAVLGLMAVAVPPAQAVPSCKGRAATIVGSSGPDQLVGTLGADVIVGRDGDDRISGLGGRDVICGGSGDDDIFGGDQADVMAGGRGNDDLLGGGGADRIGGARGNDGIFGGPGDDRLSGGRGRTDILVFDAAPHAVTVNLARGIARGHGNDRIGGFEAVIGSSHDDRLRGSGGSDFLLGERGADEIIGGGAPDNFAGGPGNDSFVGGSGQDVVFYDEAASGVTVDLQQGTATGEGSDSLDSIEGIAGSRFNDSLTGDAGDNVWLPLGGNDTVDGAAGFDTVFYDLAGGSITGNLQTEQVTGEGTDTLTNIENLSGSPFADTLTGDGAANILEGLAGADVLDGGANNDLLLGGRGNDQLSGNVGNDSLIGGPGTDTLDGGDGNDECDGENEVNCESDPAAARARLTLRFAFRSR